MRRQRLAVKEKTSSNYPFHEHPSGTCSNIVKSIRHNVRNFSLKVSAVLGITLAIIYYVTYMIIDWPYFTVINNDLRDLCNQTDYKYLDHCNKSTHKENAFGIHDKSSLIIFTGSGSVQNCTAVDIITSSTANTSTVTSTSHSNPYQITNHFGTNIKYIQTYNGLWGMRSICMRIFDSPYCIGLPEKTLDRSKNDNNTIYVVTFSCNDLFEKKGFGTGNYMMAIYSLRRMAQQIGNIDISIVCNDAEETKDKLILPWLMGSFPRTYWYDNKNDNDDKFMEQLVTNTGVSDVSCGKVFVPQPKALPENKCRYYNSIYMYEDIIFELRRMAIALVGTLELNHSAGKWAEQYLWQTNNTISHFKNSNMQLRTPQKQDSPILSNVEIDDVAFHVRCGDVVMINNTRFGFLKFQSYNKRLLNKKYRNQFRSIGIITQPFSGQGRSEDQRGNDRCYKVIHAFKKYLIDQNYTYHRYDTDGKIIEEIVQITIRNNPDEYLTTAYARLIMALQLVVVGRSSFAAFPALSSFATEVYMSWNVDPVVAERLPSVHIVMKEPFLSSAEIQKLWKKDNGETVIRWMKS